MCILVKGAITSIFSSSPFGRVSVTPLGKTTLAVQEAFKRINPGERVPFGYTTSNKLLQEKLKVNKN